MDDEKLRQIFFIFNFNFPMNYKWNGWFGLKPFLKSLKLIPNHIDDREDLYWFSVQLDQDWEERLKKECITIAPFNFDYQLSLILK